MLARITRSAVPLAWLLSTSLTLAGPATDESSAFRPSTTPTASTIPHRFDTSPATTSTTTSTTTMPAPRRSSPARPIELPPPPVASPGCEGGWSRTDLNRAFGAERGPGGLVGGDYARAQRLPDGRVLWVFQDVFLGGDGSAFDQATFMHNVGLVEDGSCFRPLTGGGSQRPRSWIGGELETRLRHWFWPLDSVLTSDGGLAQFLVEMENRHGTGAAAGATPVRVWIATISLPDLSVASLRPAPDPSDRPLYGFSITSDEHHTYLYGNCYRQFTQEDVPVGHDIECGRSTFLARVPLGRPDMMPEYWSNGAWSTDRAAATPISTRGLFANPMQVRHLGQRFVAVTKVDDWFGTWVVVDVARGPAGPWVTVAAFEPATICGTRCNTYFATLLPWCDDDGSLLIALSNNAWDMRDAARHTQLYRPSVYAIPNPVLSP